MPKIPRTNNSSPASFVKITAVVFRRKGWCWVLRKHKTAFQEFLASWSKVNQTNWLSLVPPKQFLQSVVLRLREKQMRHPRRHHHQRNLSGLRVEEASSTSSVPPEVLEKDEAYRLLLFLPRSKKQLGSVKTPAWEVPEGWKVLPSTPMRRGNFSIQGEGGGSAEVSVIRLPANAGSSVEHHALGSPSWHVSRESE